MSEVWVVIPAFNEADNLAIVLPRVFDELAQIDRPHRVIVVDDGSTDNTPEVMRELQASNEFLLTYRLRRNSGKSSALKAGFLQAVESCASVVVMMDADGQDDPVELPRLVAAVDNGSDLVTGARLKRQDRFSKRTTSRVYNKVTGWLTGSPGEDFNSGFKAMTVAVAEDLSDMLYGELHRYITVIAHWLGYRVSELPVRHHARLHGTTKFGMNRYWRGFLDLVTVRFLMSYQQRPSHLFGGIGVLSLLLGATMLGYLFFERLMGERVGDRPLLITGVLMVVVGLQLLLFGLLAELVVYTRQRGQRSDHV